MDEMNMEMNVEKELLRDPSREWEKMLQRDSCAPERTEREQKPHKSRIDWAIEGAEETLGDAILDLARQTAKMYAKAQENVTKGLYEGH